MSNEIERLNLETDQLVDQRADLEKTHARSRSQFTIGLLGMLIGIVLLFTGLWWLGILLTLAGALAAVTQGIKRSRASKDLQALNDQISQNRSQIAALLESPTE